MINGKHRTSEHIEIEYKVKLKKLLDSLYVIESHPPKHPAVLARCKNWINQCIALTNEYKEVNKYGNNQKS